MNPVTCKSKDTRVKKKLLTSLEVRSNVTKVKKLVILDSRWMDGRP